MKNWSGCSSFLIIFLSFTVVFLPQKEGEAQTVQQRQAHSQDIRNSLQYPSFYVENNNISPFQDTTRNNQNLPDPTSVLYKSMIIPGWGQIVNKQIWKVPIVYGLLGGLGWYSVYTTKRYHDYRAAYYNLHDRTANDLRFGPTPEYIAVNYDPDNITSSDLEQLQNIRNTYRIRRDQLYIGLVLAYGLNIVDAYVFAHMRSFDVSEDLSMRPRIEPGIPGQAAAGLTLSINLIRKKN